MQKKTIKGWLYITVNWHLSLEYNSEQHNQLNMEMAEVASTIRSSRDRQKLFEDLYENVFPDIAEFISHRNGTFQEAKDIFQDALVIFYEKIIANKTSIKVSNEAYVFGIAKHLWHRKFNQNRTTVPLSTIDPLSIPEEYFPTVESNKLMQLLSITGEKCMELLRAFYYNKLAVEDIRINFGYRTLHSATVQKFKCLEKIRDKVKANSIHYEDFTE